MTKHLQDANFLAGSQDDFLCAAGETCSGAIKMKRRKSMICNLATHGTKATAKRTVALWGTRKKND
jgi:hypothetical protein